MENPFSSLEKNAERVFVCGNILKVQKSAPKNENVKKLCPKNDKSYPVFSRENFQKTI